jgi:hypothetical protein
MAAHVIKAAHPVRLVPDHHQAFAADLLHKEISRVRDLALVPNAYPIRRKNFRLLVGKNLGRHKVRLRQGLGPGDESLARFAKRLRSGFLHQRSLTGTINLSFLSHNEQCRLVLLRVGFEIQRTENTPAEVRRRSGNPTIRDSLWTN